MGAVIPVDVTEALMGHKGYLTDIYRIYDVEKLAEIYKQGETAVVVFGKVEESLEIRKDVKKLEQRIVDLNKEIEEQKRAIDDLNRFMESKVESITRKLWEKWLREQEEADKKALIDLQKWREEFTERYKKQTRALKPEKAWLRVALFFGRFFPHKKTYSWIVKRPCLAPPPYDVLCFNFVKSLVNPS